MLIKNDIPVTISFIVNKLNYFEIEKAKEIFEGL